MHFTLQVISELIKAAAESDKRLGTWNFLLKTLIYGERFILFWNQIPDVKKKKKFFAQLENIFLTLNLEQFLSHFNHKPQCNLSGYMACKLFLQIKIWRLMLFSAYFTLISLNKSCVISDCPHLCFMSSSLLCPFPVLMLSKKHKKMWWRLTFQQDNNSEQRMLSLTTKSYFCHIKFVVYFTKYAIDW